MLIVGVDLGATNLRTTLVRDGTAIGSQRVPTPQDAGAAISETLCSTVETLCDQGDVTPTDIDGVGVGTIGPLDSTGVATPPNLPAVSHIPLRDPLTALTKAPVRVRNDAIAGLIGERDAGAPPNTVYLTLSSGVGAGACVDGTVLTGAHGNAAEVGHFVVDPDDNHRCGCGGTGHWEAYCGGDAIPDHARHHHDSIGTATDLPLTTDIDAQTILEAAGTDPLATAVTDQIAEYNAVGLAALVHAYDPTAIIVGGAVARNHPDHIITRATDRLPDHVVRDAPPVTLTELDNPVLAGALTLGRNAATEA